MCWKMILKVITTIILVPLELGLMLLGMGTPVPSTPIGKSLLAIVVIWGLFFLIFGTLLAMWVDRKTLEQMLETPEDQVSRLRKRVHRLENGLCIKCGYDIHGLSTRCPECGTEVPYRRTVTVQSHDRPT